jgi:hypothetical protein
VFSDRAWGWKFAAALAVIGAFGVVSYERGRDLHPSYADCLIRPERYDGAVVVIYSAVVGAPRPDGPQVRAWKFDVPVRGRIDAPPGSVVSLRGVFRAADGSVELITWRPLGPLAGRRWLVEAVSLLVFAAIAWNFLRHFAFRRDRLQVEVGS